MGKNQIVVCFDPNPLLPNVEIGRASVVWLIASAENDGLAGSLRKDGKLVTIFQLGMPGISNVMDVLDEVRVHHPEATEHEFLIPSQGEEVFTSAIRRWKSS